MNYNFLRILVVAICFVSVHARADRWILKNPRASAADLAAAGFETIRNLNLGGHQFVVVANRQTAAVASAVADEGRMLGMTGRADAVYPDLPIRLVESVPASGPAAQEAWHVGKMKYDELPREHEGSKVVVAILDTGVEIEHEALADKIWVNAGEIPDNEIDDDGNGYVDDVNGWSFARNSNDVGAQGAHGTHCAGIVASAPRDDKPGAPRGVAPQAKIMSVHIIQGKAGSFMSDAAAGIKYAADNGAKLLSNSWRVYKSWSGYKPTPENVALLREAIVHAEKKGALFIAAAGNERRDIDAEDAEPIYPVGFTGLPSLVGVAASDKEDGQASFTNYGESSVHVAAPGVAIVSTVTNGKWQQMSGTSMATPLVAGVLARALSAGLSAAQVVERLQETSDAMDDWDGVIVAGGIINPKAFLTGKR